MTAAVVPFPANRRLTKLKVYIAGPIRQGDTFTNIRNAIEAGNKVFDLGHIPFIPHMNYTWALICPRHDSDWLEWDFEWLKVCDVMVRLPGPSLGSDMEEAFAKKNGIPVYTLEEFCGQQQI